MSYRAALLALAVCAFSASGAQTPRIVVAPGSGSGAGRLTSDVGNLDCLVAPGGTTGFCTPWFLVGTTVVLTATPDSSGYTTFDGWSGDCASAGTAPACTLLIDATPNVGARFVSHADLVPLSIVMPASVAPGATRVPVRIEVANQGSLPLPPDAVARVVLLTDGIAYRAPESLAEVRTPALAAGERWSTLADMDVPSTLPAPQTWHLQLVVDPDDRVHEEQEGNNILTSPDSMLSVAGFKVSAGYGGPVFNITPTGSGTLVSDPAGISCRLVGLSLPEPGCSAAFGPGTRVTFLPHPDARNVGGDFVGVPECNMTLACSLIVSAPLTLYYDFWYPPSSRTIRIFIANGHVQDATASTFDCPPRSRTPGGSPPLAGCTAAFYYDSIGIFFSPDGDFVLDLARTTIRHCDIATSWRSANEFMCQWSPSFAFPASSIVFSLPALAVSPVPGNAGGGVVRWNPYDVATVCDISAPGVQDAATCGPRSLPAHAPITLKAIPSPGYEFGHWGGRCSGSVPECTIRLVPLGTYSVAHADTDTVFAAFVRRGRISVALSGSGTGRVFSTPTGISCSTTSGAPSAGECSALFALRATTTLTAIPATGSVFAGWSQPACGSRSDCDVVPDTIDTLLSASFVPATIVAVRGAGDGGGSVESAPPGMLCTITSSGAASPGCVASFVRGAEVTLTPRPAPGASFTGWGGACAGAMTCTLRLDAESLTVVATFAHSRTLTLATAGPGRGIIASQPGLAPAIACVFADGKSTGSCSASYAAGTVVTLTASPASNSVFAGWTGACAGAGPCALTIPGSGDSPGVGARFDWLPVSADAAIDAILGVAPLTSGQSESLDLQGNRNGVVDLGDVLALLRRSGMPAQTIERARQAGGRVP